MEKESLVEPRKLPRQERSRATVDAILRAGAQVLARDGYNKASTNRIAELAGVSIGSLYQYFPNKDALVMAIAEEHSRTMVALLAEAAGHRGESLEGAIRVFVRGMIRAHAIDPGVHRALVQQVLHLGIEAYRNQQVAARLMVQRLLEEERKHLSVANPEVMSFVLVAAVEGVIHSAVFEQAELLADPAFEEELVRMVLRYLGI